MSVFLPRLQQDLWESARMMRRTLEDQTPVFLQNGCAACGGGTHDPNSGHQPVSTKVSPIQNNMGPRQDVWSPAMPQGVQQPQYTIPAPYAPLLPPATVLLQGQQLQRPLHSSFPLPPLPIPRPVPLPTSPFMTTSFGLNR